MSNQSNSDASASNIVEIEAGLEKLALSANLAPPGDGLNVPTVSMSLPLSHACHEIGQVLAASPLYRFGDGFVTIDKEGEFQPMSAVRFCSWAEGYLYTTMDRRAGQEIMTMRKEYAAGVLASDSFREQIREIKAVNHVRLPVWRGTGEIKPTRSNKPFWLAEGSDWHVELLPPGYDEKTKTFTLDGVPYAEDLSLEDAEAFLLDVLKAFPFAKEDGLGNTRSLGVHIAALMGVYCRAMFQPGTVRPMVIYSANQSGSGKSLLMRMALAPVFGTPAEKSKPSNDEIGKILDIAAMEARPYLVLDDCPSLHSNALNQFITSHMHEARVLGQSRNVRREIVTQVFATGNQLTLAEDLVRRSLVVDLFEPGKAPDRTFKELITDEWLFLTETRSQFLAALWAIMRSWKEADMPHDSEVRSSSASMWASVIGSLVNHLNPKLKPFAKRMYEMGGDESGAALEALLIAIASDAPDGGAEYKPSDVIDEAEERGLLEAICGYAKDPRKALGHKVKKMRGRQFTDSHGRRFEFGKRDASYGAVYPIRFMGS